jgi:hypothetical protein
MNQVTSWVKAHPRLTAWIVLAVGMNAMVVYEARSVGLLLGQWVAQVVATTLVAGLCVWIIGWEDDDEEEPAATNGGAPAKPEAATQKPAEPEAAPSPPTASKNS